MMYYKGTKQINNIKIKYIQDREYVAIAPNRKVLKDNMTLEEAELYCARNKDYVIKKGERK